MSGKEKIEVADENKLNQYNPNDEYYNDRCQPYASGNGTDISLADRKKEFVDNNMTLCEEDCEFIKYDYETGRITTYD